MPARATGTDRARPTRIKRRDTENRKVGGSTPPLATKSFAGLERRPPAETHGGRSAIRASSTSHMISWSLFWSQSPSDGHQNATSPSASWIRRRAASSCPSMHIGIGHTMPKEPIVNASRLLTDVAVQA
jgi:hypothetical protein